MSSCVGEEIELKGWRQGAVVKKEDTYALAKNDKGFDYIIITSQSCDITYKDLGSEPLVEGILARKIESEKGDYTYGKNPRVLHTHILVKGVSGIGKEVCVELKAFEKISFDRAKLKSIKPDSSAVLVNRELNSLISWLVARYARPALPTEFNRRISLADPKKKNRKKAKSLSASLSGIYVDITPDKEISKEEDYRVNLLGVVSASYSGDIERDVRPILEAYSAPMTQAGMEVKVAVRKEDEVSIATIKGFKRLYYDDLSIKNDEATPVEI